jgi:transposase
MSHRSPYPQELRERAIRMVAEIRPDYETEWAAIGAVAARLGVGSSEAVRKWIRQAEIDGGRRPGRTTEKSAELRRLRAEVKELLAPELAPGKPPNSPHVVDRSPAWWSLRLPE